METPAWGGGVRLLLARALSRAPQPKKEAKQKADEAKREADAEAKRKAEEEAGDVPGSPRDDPPIEGGRPRPPRSRWQSNGEWYGTPTGG